MRYLLFFAILAFSACTDDATDASMASKTSGPALSVESTPAVVSTGALSAGKITGFHLDKVEGCSCSLRLNPNLEGRVEEDLFYVFSWKSAGPGVIGLNGQEHVVERGASLDAGGNSNYASYLHQNGAFSVQTSLTEDGEAGEEGSAYSGKVKVKNLETGEEMVVNVTGICSC